MVKVLKNSVVFAAVTCFASQVHAMNMDTAKSLVVSSVAASTAESFLCAMKTHSFGLNVLPVGFQNEVRVSAVEAEPASVQTKEQKAGTQETVNVQTDKPVKEKRFLGFRLGYVTAGVHFPEHATPGQKVLAVEPHVEGVSVRNALVVGGTFLAYLQAQKLLRK